MKAESRKQFNKAESTELDQSSSGLSALSFTLKIGYDGKRAANNLTGLGNYSRSLIEQLADAYPANEYFIYSPKAKENILKLKLFTKPNVHLKVPKSNRFLWRSIGIKNHLKADQIDLFHGLSHEIPFDIYNTGIKSIVTIHDLIFLRKPEYYKLIDRLIYKFKSKYACENADRIIAISEKTAADIVAYYEIDPSKIDVVYQSCDDSFKSLLNSTAKENVREKYNLPAKYLLSLGTIEPRKNLLLIIKSLAKIDSNISLVVVGKRTPYLNLVKQEIENLGLTDRVIFFKNLPFSDLPAIYQMASIFIYPSFYEGFGIPIIEALYSKTPVVAATGSCLEEAGGPDSIYVSPTNHQELADAINLILANEQLQETMAQKGLDYVQRFNNEIVVQQLINCYLKTLEL